MSPHRGSEAGLPSDDGLPALRPKTNIRNVLYILGISTGMLAGGAINAMIATTLAQPTFISYMKLDGSNATSLIGATNGTFYAGGAIGVFFGSWAADRFGRRMAMAINAALSLICSALLAGSVNMTMFIIVRFFTGFGASQFVTLTPLYQSEISPPQWRGLMVATMGMSNVIGYNVANWTGVGFYFIPGQQIQWRMPFVIICGLCIIVLILLPFIPESPRWLIMMGRQEEAEAVVRKIHTNSHDADDQFVRFEINQMERQIQEERELAVSYWQMFADKKWRRRSCLCVLVGFLGQSTGVLVINNFGPFFYKSLGMNSLQQLYLAGGYNLVGFAMAVVSGFFVDRIGRVKLMVWGAIAQVGVLCIEAAIIASFQGADNKSANIAGIWAFYFYEAIYGLTWDCTQFIYVSELMPTHLRAKGVTVAIAALYFPDVGYLTATTIAFNRVGWKFFMIFIAIAPPLILLLWWWAPETKGKTLEEIGGLFGDHVATGGPGIMTDSPGAEDEKASIIHVGTRGSEENV
ncbi:hypothetical protein B7463_g3053, partial [Scytalidium lignicola]